MLRGYWFKYIAFGLAALAATSLVWLLYRGYNAEHGKERSEVAAHDVGASQKPLEFRCALTTKSAAVCTLDQPDTVGETEHSKAELKAEQDSAEWALLSMLIGIVGLFITCIGLIYVAGTLAVTKDAVDLANRDFRATHRPRLRVRYVKSISLEVGKPIKFDVIVANVGDGFADIVSLDVDCFLRTPKNGCTEIISSPQNMPHRLLVGQQTTFSITTKTIYLDKEIGNIQRGNFTYSVTGTIHYKDGNGTDRITALFRVYDPIANVFRKAPEGDPYAEDDFEN